MSFFLIKDNFCYPNTLRFFFPRKCLIYEGLHLQRIQTFLSQEFLFTYNSLAIGGIWCLISFPCWYLTLFGFVKILFTLFYSLWVHMYSFCCVQKTLFPSSHPQTLTPWHIPLSVPQWSLGRWGWICVTCAPLMLDTLKRLLCFLVSCSFLRYSFTANITVFWLRSRDVLIYD